MTKPESGLSAIADKLNEARIYCRNPRKASKKP